MSRNEIFETYAENAFDSGTKENSIIWKREWYDANFKKFFPKKKAARMLDIGPGLGELLLTERDWGYTNCFAVDISPSVVQYCKKQGFNCEETDDTLAWLKEHRESFDLITVLDVFEHIPQEIAIDFLRACKEALSKNGILILQVPNVQSAESFLHRYNDITHVFGYSQHTLEQLISIVGFETVRFYPFEEYPGNDPDTKMLRRLRSIYWKYLRMHRKITHNLNPEILTPELFAVMAKVRYQCPEHVMKDEFSDRNVSLKDIEKYLEIVGIKSEAFAEICKINDLERSIHIQNDTSNQTWNKCNSRLEELGKSIELCESKLKKLNGRWKEHESKFQELCSKLAEMNHILEQQRKEWEKCAGRLEENCARVQMLEGRLEEQNVRLLQLIDQHMERIGQHNVWTRERLDYLEMKVEKMDRLLMNMRYPFQALKKRLWKKEKEDNE